MKYFCPQISVRMTQKVTHGCKILYHKQPKCNHSFITVSLTFLDLTERIILNINNSSIRKNYEAEAEYKMLSLLNFSNKLVGFTISFLYEMQPIMVYNKRQQVFVLLFSFHLLKVIAQLLYCCKLSIYSPCDKWHSYFAGGTVKGKSLKTHQIFTSSSQKTSIHWSLLKLLKKTLGVTLALLPISMEQTQLLQKFMQKVREELSRTGAV